MSIKIALAGNPNLRQNDPVQRPDRLQSICGQLARGHGGKEGGQAERATRTSSFRTCPASTRCLPLHLGRGGLPVLTL